MYDKIWSDLSRGDRRVLHAMAVVKTGKVSDIRSYLGASSNEFSPYRQRLIRKGLISGEGRGYVEFTLPAFDEYALANFDEE